MHLFLELTTLAFFVWVVVHAVARRGRTGVSFMAALLALGLVRETLVILREILYGFAELDLMLGKTPVIAMIIWGYSIYIAVVWAEGVTGQSLDDLRPSPGFLGAVGLFMICLVGFYEPFLELVGMARWQEGTRRTLGVPWVALVGYPTLSVPFVAAWSALERRAAEWTRAKKILVHGTAVVGLAALHALGLQALKDLLGW